MSPDLANAVYAMPTGGPFLADLARKVTNSGDTETAAVWLLNFVSDFLRREKQMFGPLQSFDFAIYDIEAIDSFWPVMQLAESAYREQGSIVGYDSPLPDLARFLVERLPAIWGGKSWKCFPPLSRVLRLADRADTLVGLFAVGKKPTGSKDPLALRRAARQLLKDIVFPIVREAA